MPQAPDSNLLAIIGRIYEAAENPLIWSEVLRLLGNAFGSTVNVFVLSDKKSPLSEVVVSDGDDLQWEREYDSYYHSTNIVLGRLQPLMTPGLVVSSGDHFADSEILNSEYFQDFLRRRDVFYLLGGVVSSTPTSNALFTLARSRKRHPWTSAEKEVMSSLMPHLQRAARFSSYFATIQQEHDEILNRLPMGIIVLNESGKVEFLNRAAEVIVRKKDGLCCDANGIHAVDPTQSAHLRALISNARLTAAGKAAVGGGSMSVTQTLSGRPLSVLIAPMMPSAASPLSHSPRVAIFITDPEAPQPTNIERLAGMFDLTPAESRMAGQLLEGKSVIEAADALGITQQTARVHLKRIFGKTYTNRQSELMRLLLSSPAALLD
jgi:DNA-binding CsgD family transcriptional regulator/PAS domain-containing protein